MPRKTRRAVSTSSGAGPKSGILGYVLTGLFCALLGAGSTYVALRPALAQASATRSSMAQADREQGNQEEDRGQWTSAIDSYQKAISEGIDNPDIRTDLGVAYFKASQPQQALEQYAIAQHQNPAHENSLFNEAIAYAKLGNTGRAIATWQAYLLRFPNGQHIAAAKSLIAEVQSHSLPPTPTGKTP